MTILKSENATGNAIRHYVYALLRKNGTETVKLPSSYELAKQFGVTRRVSRYVLEQLVNEGFLITKPRVGTFTNPHKNYIAVTPVQKRMSLIGILDRDGARFCYGRAEAHLMAALWTGLMRRNCYIHPVEFSTVSQQSRIDELKNLNLDGLVWR